MAIDYRIDEEGIVWIRAIGKAPPEDYRELLRRLESDPVARPEMPRICDYRKVEVSLNRDQMHEVAELARHAGRHIWGSRTAVLVSDDAAYGMTRMFQVLVEDTGQPFEVFRDVDEALAWIRSGGAGAEG